MLATTNTSGPPQKTLHSLHDLRVDYPWECIAYARKNNLRQHNDWKWIDDYVKSDTLFAKIVQTYKASKVGEAQFQYGVQVPKTAKQALALDQANGDNLWKSSMKLELQQIVEDFSAFKVLDDDEVLPQGYKQVPYHFTFAVKVDLRRKSRLVIDGN